MGRGRRGRGVLVGSTENEPELVETIPIAPEAAAPQVVLSLGPEDARALHGLKPGDRLWAYAELEVTTDAPVDNHPGRIGNAYTYAPKVEAAFLLAQSPDHAEEHRREALALAKPWRQRLTHEQHHGVATFAAGPFEVPAGGLPWGTEAHVNVGLAAHNRKARSGDVLLIGQNERDRKVVVQDMAGIRVVRSRGGAEEEARRSRETTCLCEGIPISKKRTVVYSHRLEGLEEGEQLLVVAEIVADASRLGKAARISTRLFLADGPEQTEPGGQAAELASWNGHLSKTTGFNCVPADGPHTTRKFGVATIHTAPRRPLHVNVVSVSAAPFGGSDRQLPLVASRSHVEVTRYPARLAG